MKILALTAENVKKLTVVHIEPDGNLVQITGRNGQGKTSVLDAIWWALEGMANVQKQPIRKGADRATITLLLGGSDDRRLKVTRSFWFKKDPETKEPTEEITTSIIIENGEGMRAQKPQELLDGLIGELTMDPLAFIREKPPAQRSLMQGFVSGVDFDALDAAHKKDFSDRTEVNRKVKDAWSRYSGIVVPEGTPEEPVDVDALVAQLEQAGEANRQIEIDRGNRASFIDGLRAKNNQAASLDETIAELQQRIERATAERDQLNAEVAAGDKEVQAWKPLPEPVDTTDIRTKITEARQTNEGVAAAKRKAEVKAEAEALETEQKALTKSIEDRKASRDKAIAEAKLPVKGLGFDEEGITLDGLPFDQASDAQQLRASMAIAAALNPKLRVLRIRDGSLLDEDGMKLVAAFADEHDMQVWVERVDSSGSVGIVLEDGHVKGAAPAEAE